MVTIVLPIYYEQQFKTKPSRRFLVGLNWYRNAHHMLTNLVKRHYHELTAIAMGENKFNRIRVTYRVYAGRSGTDGHNIRAIIEKYFMDGLVNCGAIPDDSVEYVLGDASEYYIDRENPRIEIDIIEV